MGTLGPNEHKTRRSTSGGHFIKNSHGGPRGPKKPSAVGAFLRREKAVHAPVSDHTRKRGRSVLSQLNGGPTVKKLVVSVILLYGMFLSGCIGDKLLGNVAESNVDAMESGRKQAMR